MNDRKSERHALALEVEYRTAGSFLVAYTANLSRGGMFIESAHPQPVGTSIGLKLSIPGSDIIEFEGVVAWVRHEPEGNEPAGMGVSFTEPLDQRHGSMIDILASKFQGLRVVVLAAGRSARGQLSREVRSMLKKADVIEADSAQVAAREIREHADLVLIDLDDAKDEGLLGIRAGKAHAASPVPVIACVGDATLRLRAQEQGADELLPNPPSHTDLQAAILRALSRPSRVT